MAGAHYAVTSFIIPSAKTATTSTPTIRRKPVVLSSVSTLFPSKLTKRKNYLRLKLLKTLKKPYPTTTPLLPLKPQTSLIIPMESIETPRQQDLELPSDQIPGEPCTAFAGEGEKSVELSETSGAVGVVDGSVGKFSTRSVLKFGLYLVGLFVFQTICAVWVLGSANSGEEQENSETDSKTKVLESSTNGRDEKKFLLNGNGNTFRGKLGLKPGGFVYVDESELEAKIAEIRAMAREARESEKRDSQNNGFESDFDDIGDGELVNKSDSSRIRSGIEKEVDARLVKLQKRFNSIWEKSPGSMISYLSKFGKVEDKVNKDGLDAKEVDGALMFKKKQKFRSQPTKPRNGPKGFQGLEKNHSISKKKKSNSVNIDSVGSSGSIGNSGLNSLDREQQIDLRDGDLRKTISMVLDEDAGREPRSKESKSLQTAGKKLEKKRGRTKVGKEMGVANTEPSNGVVQETRDGRPLVEVMKSIKSSELETKNSLSSIKENKDTATKSDEPAMLNINGGSKYTEVMSKPVANKVRDKQSDLKNDFWWLNLPYALAILLRRGSDTEGAGGLYTLKINSHAQDQSVSAYTVAFEDRSDANNFCYLLESFFEDLGDFSADIVPLSITELHEAVKSHTMKLILVKKGQLQLYAGQPLADVEMALRSLVEQN